MINDKLRTAPVRDVASAASAIRDIETYINKLIPFVARTEEAAPVSGVFFLARNSAGEWKQYSLVAGPAITLTLDENAQTLTIQTP